MMRSTRFVLFGFVVFFWLRGAHAQHMNSAQAPCRNAVVTVEAANCFGSAYKVADRKLNQVYAHVLSVLRPDDQEKLRVAQRLWLQYRDATCAAERDLYEGETGASPAHLACLEEVTRQRSADLQTTYGWVVEKFSK